jgi:hypothetical protein
LAIHKCGQGEIARGFRSVPGVLGDEAKLDPRRAGARIRGQRTAKSFLNP